jgi:adenosylcobinamide kinase/adenosylcobinamide-phosphate guanylyltransferase
MGQLILVLGGVRSGKSRWAEHLAAAAPPVTYLATAQAGDTEMAGRIDLHRQRRPPDWRTVEEPWNVAQSLARIVQPAGGAPAATGSVLVECLTLWMTNRLLGIPGHPAEERPVILDAVEALAVAARDGRGRVIVVSNEVGLGILPANALARRFGDLLGEANQRLAAAAAEVYACWAGIPIRLKGVEANA